MSDGLMTRIALVPALALVLVLTATTGAIAKTAPAGSAGIAPRYLVADDAYESDDTSAQARLFGADLGEESTHTLTAGDEDWVRLSAEDTGEPFVIETQASPAADGQCRFDSVVEVWEADPAAEGGLRLLDARNDDSGSWDSLGSTLYFTAPGPGTYYARIAPGSDGANGDYTLYVSQGIARRIGGANRFETAARLSGTMFPDASNPFGDTLIGPRGVILVNGNAFSDALSAGAWGAQDPLGGGLPYPVLLTRADYLPKVTVDEIVRLAKACWWSGDEFRVYVVGGPGGVTDAELAEIRALPYVTDAVRIAGDNRFETAAKVASMAIGPAAPLAVTPRYVAADTVVLVNGFKWPDGVASGSLCGAMRAPILLSAATTLTPATQDWLYAHADTVRNVLIVGDGSSVATSVADFLASGETTFSVERIGGANRYETAYMLARSGVERGYLDPAGLTLVTGETFPDGLASGPFAMLTRRGTGAPFGPGPILLTRRPSLTTYVTDFWKAYGFTVRPSYLIGSSAAISDEAASAFGGLWSVPSDPE